MFESASENSRPLCQEFYGEDAPCLVLDSLVSDQMNNGHETGHFHPGRNVVKFLSFLVIYFFFIFRVFANLFLTT